MDDERRMQLVQDLVTTAERLEGLAETADLMGDDGGVARFRSEASTIRMRAMALLDD
jgi:hypothetical protein